MLIIYKKPNKKPITKEIPIEESEQYIDILAGSDRITMDSNLVMFCDLKGRLNGKLPNIVSDKGVVFGNVVFCGMKDGSITGLTCMQIAHVQEYIEKLRV